MAKGWISLHRQIMEHWIWTDSEPFDRRSAWIDLLLLANHEEAQAPYKGEVVTFKVGTVNRSIQSLADRWHWSRWKVRAFLRLLESDGMITINCTTHRTTVTVEKYSFFQNSLTTKRTTNRQQTDSKPTQTIMKNNNNNTNKGRGGYEQFLAERAAMDEAWARMEDDDE